MKRILTAMFIVSFALISSAQETFKDYQDAIQEEFKDDIPEYDANGGRDKLISFPNYGYYIKGVISKGKLTVGTIANIYRGTSESDLLLKGRVLDASGACVVKGVRYNDDESTTYGIFILSNYFGSLSCKPKSANALEIKEKEILYQCGKYATCDAIVQVDGEFSKVVVDGRSGGRSYNYLEVPVTESNIERVGYKNIYDLLLTASEDIVIEKNDGSVFCGKTNTFASDNGRISFEQLEGTLTFDSGPIIRKIVALKDGYMTMTTEYSDPKYPIKTQTLYTFPASCQTSEWRGGKLWDLLPYLNHCEKLRNVYSDGSSFEGVVEISNIIVKEDGNISYNTNIIKGVQVFADGTRFEGTFVNGQVGTGSCQWPNGDRFEGNLSNNFFYGVPTEGTTYFKDGTSAKGNWLAKYKLSEAGYKRLVSLKYPSLMRDAASSTKREEIFDDYEGTEPYWTGVSYFSPTAECEDTFRAVYMSYNKKKDIYYFSGEQDMHELEIQLDENKRHILEAYYDEGELVYVTYFKWYSNGEIESIKCYDQKRKEIYLSCNFYSNGVLRSAYKYGVGNAGKNILLLSKESHPTFGGYTVKQYDLNGNFELNSAWDIGESGDSFFYSMVPYKFYINKWRKKDTPNSFVDKFLSK
ncbi:MAG: hypothetical protein LKI59_03935 [Bacteroidales bacterium]|jgi:hypothetical protein|nr:hypothetical protein [Bacteroidales bacterium]